MAYHLAKLLDLDEESEFTVIVGDEVIYNQFLKVAEEVRGECAIFFHFDIPR